MAVNVSVCKDRNLFSESWYLQGGVFNSCGSPNYNNCYNVN